MSENRSSSWSYRGVVAAGKHFQAYISFNNSFPSDIREQYGRELNIGMFDTPELAAHARDL